MRIGRRLFLIVYREVEFHRLGYAIFLSLNIKKNCTCSLIISPLFFFFFYKLLLKFVCLAVTVIRKVEFHWVGYAIFASLEIKKKYISFINFPSFFFFSSFANFYSNLQYFKLSTSRWDSLWRNVCGLTNCWRQNEGKKSYRKYVEKNKETHSKQNEFSFL